MMKVLSSQILTSRKHMASLCSSFKRGNHSHPLCVSYLIVYGASARIIRLFEFSRAMHNLIHLGAEQGHDLQTPGSGSSSFHSAPFTRPGTEDSTTACADTTSFITEILSHTYRYCFSYTCSLSLSTYPLAIAPTSAPLSPSFTRRLCILPLRPSLISRVS